MTPSFDLANKVILDIKNDGFDGDMLPFFRYEKQLSAEASKIALENLSAQLQAKLHVSSN